MLSALSSGAWWVSQGPLRLGTTRFNKTTRKLPEKVTDTPNINGYSKALRLPSPKAAHEKTT